MSAYVLAVMQTMLEGVVVAVLGWWLALSVLCQLPTSRLGRLGRVLDGIAAADIVGFIPAYTFFAPNPGTTDYHLLFRDRTDTGGFSSWREVRVSRRRGLSQGVWNPDKRTAKALIDMIMSLVTLPRDFPPSAVKVTAPYICLVGYLSALPRPPTSAARQFMIMETFGFESSTQPRVLILSEFHAFDDASLAEAGVPQVGHV